MHEEICSRPNDCRGFLHKKLLGLGKKALGIGASFIPGPVGALARGAVGQLSGQQMQRGGFGGFRPPRGSRFQVPKAGIGGAVQRFLPGGATGFTTVDPRFFSGGRGGGERVPPDIRNVAEARARMQAGDGTSALCPDEPRVCPPRGFHINKSSYFLRDGTFVPRGTKFVRNRRLNNANGRAQGKAIVRLEKGAENAKKLLKATGFRTISKQSSRELRMRKRTGHR